MSLVIFDKVNRNPKVDYVAISSLANAPLTYKGLVGHLYRSITEIAKKNSENIGVVDSDVISFIARWKRQA